LIIGLANVTFFPYTKVDILTLKQFGFAGVLYSTIVVGILSFSLNLYPFYNRLIKIRGEGK